MQNSFYASDGELYQVDNAAGAATSAVDSTAVDMTGYDAVRFIVHLGTGATNNSIKAQQSSDNGSADDFSDLTGTSVAASSSIKTLVLDVIRPQKQYVRCEVTRGTSSTVDTIVTIRYKARNVPVTQAATTALEQWSSPAEGTA